MTEPTARVGKNARMATTSSPSPVGPAHEAKRPLTVIAGPYGHPFHPALVTVPIGAWIASMGFDLAARVSDEPEVFAKGSFWLIALGLVGAAVAGFFGMLDLLTIPRNTKAFRTGVLHLLLNSAVIVLYVVNLLVRQGRLDKAGAVPVALVALSAVALALLSVSGWLGGKLAYRYGVRVAAEADQAEGFLSP
jgi:uncharacterized membrane protein